jgi:hypothetical protein
VSDLIERAKAALEGATPGPWMPGEPPSPWREEWFIAKTIYGDKVVLRSLPEEWSYDYTTADHTYMIAANIVCWMQFPDSEYIAPPEPDLARALIDTTAERDALLNCGIVEIAARNPRVMEYVEHWEGRAKKAEAERDALRERVARLEAALLPFAEEAEGWADFTDCQELVEPWAEGPEDLRLKVKHLRVAFTALQEDTPQ